MSANRRDLIERVRQRLVAGARDAGWGYYAGKGSRIEPTCWVLLALARSAGQSPEAWATFAQPHRAYLARLQGPDGLLADTEPALANLVANGLAAIALDGREAHTTSQTQMRLLSGLVALKGVRLDQIDPRQDSTLQGWPWVRDTFSWVEPTAWCLLALKRIAAGGEDAARLARQQEAERLLANRMCTGGGWNFGNATALGQDLRAYVPTTAVALMALQDRRSESYVKQSLAMLQAQRLAETGTMTLALVSICLRLFDQPTADVDDRLEEAVANSEETGNLQAMAMALYALSADLGAGDAFRVA